VCVFIFNAIVCVDPDYTLYPFSTQNTQDYKNLLSVYTDAVFFPNLREMDFRYVYAYMHLYHVHIFLRDVIFLYFHVCISQDLINGIILIFQD